MCIAAQEGHEDCVRVLMDYGADLSHSDKYGRSALKVAAKGGHENVVRIIEEQAAYLQDHSRASGGGGGGGSLGTASLTSGSTTETKPCSAILCQPGESPNESPESTCDNRRSFISLGNNSSGKSSGNLTTSTNKSSKSQTTPVPARSLDPGNDMSFAAQLQHASRSKHRPVSRMLSPLSEPLSPIYVSPPISPPTENICLDTYSTPYSSQSPSNTGQLRNMSNGSAVGRGQRTSAPPSHITNSSPSHTAPEVLRNSVGPISFNHEGHMRIILGNSPPEQVKNKRNGIVTNPNFKNLGLPNLAGARKQIKSAFSGGGGGSPKTHFFNLKKETPL